VTSPLPSFDPLAALPPCPGEPGCHEYLVRRGDTLSSVASRYLVPVSTVLALNPELGDPSTIVVGQVLYLGRDPFARLEPCPDAPECYRYIVRPGDLLSTIAGRFGLTLEAVLAANPSVTDPNAIFSGQVIRLPRLA
jgi:LysM repeat protein